MEKIIFSDIFYKVMERWSDKVIPAFAFGYGG